MCKALLLVLVALFSLLPLFCAYGDSLKADSSIHISFLPSVLEARLSTPSFSFRIRMRRNDNGYIEMDCPPSFSLKLSESAFLGQLRKGPLFSTLTEPDAIHDSLLRFSGGRTMYFASDPSLAPDFGGVFMTLGNADLFLLSPLVNPSSPLGLGFSFGIEGLYGAFLLSSSGSRTTRESEDLQLSWRRQGINRLSLLYLFGQNAHIDIGEATFGESAFVQGALDLYMATSNAIGYDLELGFSDIAVRYSQRYEHDGIRIVRTSATPENTRRLELELGNRLCLELGYESRTFAKPLYGGLWQRKDMELDIRVSCSAASLSIRHSILYGEDRGKEEKSKAELEVKVPKSDDVLKITASTTLNRETYKADYFSGTELEISDSHLSFSTTGHRTEVVLGWSIKQDNLAVEFSINQDREMKASLTARL